MRLQAYIGNDPELVKRVTDRVAYSYGGATVTKGTGFWVNDDARMIEEPATIVEVLTYHESTDLFIGLITLALADSDEVEVMVVKDNDILEMVRA